MSSISPADTGPRARWCPAVTRAAAVALCLLLGAPSLRAVDRDPAEAQIEHAIAAGNYGLAEKLAIVNFRGDLHCRVQVERARAHLRAAKGFIDDSSPLLGPQLERAASALRQAREAADAARIRARRYVEAGWSADLETEVSAWLNPLLGDLDALEAALQAGARQARPLDDLIALAHIPDEEITKLEPQQRLILGFHLIDRGAFEQASERCFQPLLADPSAALRGTADYAQEWVRKWPTAAPSRTRWDNLVNKGLDAYDALLAETPAARELAGWLLTLVARLAREHYDVPPGTIHETLSVLKQYGSPPAGGVHEQLLGARLAHERFLLERRNEVWTGSAPPAEHLDGFERTSSWWYAAEAALIQASEGHSPPAAMDRCTANLAKLRQTNDGVAEALQKSVDRFIAGRGSFDTWMQLAQLPDYRDHRGTVLPDVLIETRADLTRRVREGFESMIVTLLAQNQIDRAFQVAQQAKALTAGRTLTAPGAAQPEPLGTGDLLGSKLMSVGEGGDQRIPRKELFIEYFVGPTRAWAFYVFAPGDAFGALQVATLDRAAFEAACRQTITALRGSGRAPDPGDWLLGGSPPLATLWNQLEDFKKTNRLRRLVVAPDGPLCFVPLHAIEPPPAATIQYLPTAAALGRADYFEVGDIQLMWSAQCGDLLATPPQVRRVRGSCTVTLWPQATLRILLHDAAE